MQAFVLFFRNNAFYSYILFLVAIVVFASMARFLNHFITHAVEKSRFGKRGVSAVFTPFIILLFITAGQSLFFLFFQLSPALMRSFSHFLNIQIVWVIFWIAMAAAKFGVHESSITKINLRKLYPVMRIVLLLMLLTMTMLLSPESFVASLLAFSAAFLLMRLSFLINNIPVVWSRQPEPEESEKIIAVWDLFHVTLPFNVSKETISKALTIVKDCVASSDNVGDNPSILLKDLSERGIVIEAKYLVLVSAKRKETKHEVLSRTLSAFAEHKIPMSPS